MYIYIYIHNIIYIYTSDIFQMLFMILSVINGHEFLITWRLGPKELVK